MYTVSVYIVVILLAVNISIYNCLISQFNREKRLLQLSLPFVKSFPGKILVENFDSWKYQLSGHKQPNAKTGHRKVDFSSCIYLYMGMSLICLESQVLHLNMAKILKRVSDIPIFGVRVFDVKVTPRREVKFSRPVFRVWLLVTTEPGVFWVKIFL